ncbi:hypothetical protein [Herbaspirillum sp. RV1423]|uniref:hypothetical protein n=1 Tax=Herbaspirillum sp. RV1423 TaxID=1443993 RepID=UPI0012DC48A5|nr:hypothetical protein [Herbaspirillum sp. RV1423]
MKLPLAADPKAIGLVGANTGYDRILEAVGNDSSRASSVLKSLDSGRVEKWVVHTDPAGGTSIWIVNSSGKIVQADSTLVSKVLGAVK